MQKGLMDHGKMLGDSLYLHLKTLHFENTMPIKARLPIFHLLGRHKDDNSVSIMTFVS